MGRPPSTEPGDVTVPRTLAIATAWSWRILIVGAAILAVTYLTMQLRLVFLPVFLALFFTALLRPVSEQLKLFGSPPLLAALSSVILMVAVLTGIAAWVVPQFIAEFQELGDDIVLGFENASAWLVEGSPGISQEQLDRWVDSVVAQVQGSSDQIAGGVLSGAQVAVELLLGLGISLVVTFFFLKDGERIWNGIVSLFSPSKQADVEEMGSRAWTTLAGYLRGMTIVALADSVFIGIALVLLEVPGALALAVLIFFGAYVPIAGAIVTGALAVVIALIANGLVSALIVLGVVVAVQQLESNFLQPYVVGRAVQVHPVAILLGVTAGAVLGGVIGAFIAVPIVAVVTRVAGYIRERPNATESTVAKEAR